MALFATHSATAASKSAAMVMDANTGRILHSESGDALRYPASLTKMMTLYVVFELIERRRLKYESLIRISKRAAGATPSKLGLKPGSRISVRNAVKALVTKSANDIAIAVAEHISGTEERFARLMTQRARQIGMRSTTFRNASGLPNTSQKTTARDMLKLALRLQDEFPNHYKIFKTQRFSYRGKTYKNHNKLLRTLRGTNGIKTGYTRASGFNLVSSVKRDGKHVVAAVFGGKTGRARNAKMTRLLLRSLKKASRRKTRNKFPRLLARARSANPPRRARRQVARLVAPPRPARKPAQQRKRPPPQLKPASPANAGQFRRNTPSQVKIARVTPVQTLRIQPPAELTGQVIRLAPPQEVPRAQDTNRRVRQPSTLQAQMEALQRQDRQSRSNQRIVTNALPQQDRRFVVQIGAYSTPSEANNRLTAVSRSARRLLEGYQQNTQRVLAANRKPIYRAQFAGFDSASAKSTCTALKRQGINCLVQKYAAQRRAY